MRHSPGQGGATRPDSFMDGYEGYFVLLALLPAIWLAMEN